jgi:hypothetical protein
VESHAYAAARVLKIASRYKERVEVLSRSTGERKELVA